MHVGIWEYANSIIGVPSNEAFKHLLPSSFGNSLHSAAAASLTVNILKITKEKHVLHFRLSRLKHAKTHVNILNSLGTKKSPGHGRRGKIHVVPPLNSFPGDATEQYMLC